MPVCFIAAEKLRQARLTEWKKIKKNIRRGLMPSIITDVTTFNEFLPKVYNTTHTIPSSQRGFDRVWKPFFHSFDDGLNFESLISGKLKTRTEN